MELDLCIYVYFSMEKNGVSLFINSKAASLSFLHRQQITIRENNDNSGDDVDVTGTE